MWSSTHDESTTNKSDKHVARNGLSDEHWKSKHK